ncbi:hypothetical protein BB561_005406 [Smittium simulii]|uniref:Uncharacterized protein n=1 Tax=Smittium simulii TaxID=133385 RepID=A0A2T9YAI1_9FUNG|nr:hypothetical protein BB561_005406 [Smittium simulii]
MVSHASRPHTEKHIYDQVGYVCLRESLSTTELERGPSAEKYISELLFQRASIDEIYASIRNHRMLKKKSLKEIQKQIYLTPVNVEIARKATLPNISQDFSENNSDLNTREIEKIEDSKLLLDALISKIEYTIKSVQKNSNFNKIIELNDLNQSKPSIPVHLRFWEIMNEIADQLFFFVQAKALSYSDVHQRLYGLVLKDNNNILSIPSLKKDNSIIWLLLQLFHVEKVNLKFISKDFASKENILSDFLDLYNKDQILSKDAFYLRDMALQSALSHQQQNIKDRAGMRFRHPKIGLVMPFTQSFYMIQTDFGNNYKKNIIDGNYTLFQNQTLEEIIKIATISQARQYVVPNTIYGYLIPFKYDPQPLIKNGLQYLNGGIVNHSLLDYLNVGSKHRLLQLIYKMMLAHEQGPVFQFQFGPTSHTINCISPHVLDVVYKLLYSSPYTNELMMKEILEKLRRCDKAMALGNAHFSDANLIWLYTVYQLMNARLLRFFKYYAHAGHLVHHLRHSLIFSKNPMLYTTLECFALCLSKLQYDTEFLVALLNPHYDGIPITSHPQNLPEQDPDHVQELIKPKNFWFDCTLLYRNATMSISRIILIKGVGDNPDLSINDCLASLSGRPSNWAPQVLQFMAPPVRDYFIWLNTSDRISISFEDVQNILNDEAFKPILNDTLENVADIDIAVEMLLNRFSTSPGGQKLFLCVLWQMEYIRNIKNETTSVRYVANIRRVLLKFRMALKTEQVAILMDYILMDIKSRYDFNQNCNDSSQREQLIANNEIVNPPVKLELPMFYENCMVRLVPVLEYAIDRLIEAEQS